MTIQEHTEKQNAIGGVRDARIRAGRITADVYLNPTSRGQMFSVDVYASYRDSDGDWHRSSSFRAHDLPFVEKAVQQAYDHCERNREKAYYRPDKENEDERASRLKENLTRPKVENSPSHDLER